MTYTLLNLYFFYSIYKNKLIINVLYYSNINIIEIHLAKLNLKRVTLFNKNGEKRRCLKQCKKYKIIHTRAYTLKEEKNEYIKTHLLLYYFLRLYPLYIL